MYLSRLHQCALERDPDYQQQPPADCVREPRRAPLPFLVFCEAWRSSRSVCARVLGERAGLLQFPFEPFQSAYMALDSRGSYSTGPSPSLEAPGAFVSVVCPEYRSLCHPRTVSFSQLDLVRLLRSL